MTVTTITPALSLVTAAVSAGTRPDPMPEAVDIAALQALLYAYWELVSAERCAKPVESFSSVENEALDLLGHLLISAVNAARHVRNVRLAAEEAARLDAHHVAMLAAANR